MTMMTLGNEREGRTFSKLAREMESDKKEARRERKEKKNDMKGK